MDETTIAFEPPHVRAAATGAARALDRISVRDYTRAVEIGAFASERGVSQRVRFNVVLEVCHHAAAEDDDVDKVISYDTITAAIEAELAHERVNLLETLAERVARRCLADPRAVRAFVRVEKLDRIPGALGVEIVRARPEGTLPLRPAAAPAAADGPRPSVIFVPNAVLAGPHGPAWRAALAAGAAPRLVALEPALPQPPAADAAALRIGLLAIEQNAWALAASDPRFLVAAARTEIDWALRQGRPVIWAPTKLVIDAVDRLPPDAARPLALALWLAAEIGAERLIAVGDRPPDGPHAVPVTLLAPAAAGSLAAAEARATA